MKNIIHPYIMKTDILRVLCKNTKKYLSKSLMLTPNFNFLQRPHRKIIFFLKWLCDHVGCKYIRASLSLKYFPRNVRLILAHRPVDRVDCSSVYAYVRAHVYISMGVRWRRRVKWLSNTARVAVGARAWSDRIGVVAWDHGKVDASQRQLVTHMHYGDLNPCTSCCNWD
jgi:hypothetical protein